MVKGSHGLDVSMRQSVNAILVSLGIVVIGVEGVETPSGIVKRLLVDAILPTTVARLSPPVI